MTVGEVLELNKGLDVLIEVHYEEFRDLFGHDRLVHVTKTNVYDDLTLYSKELVKRVYCYRFVAPIYTILSTINGSNKDELNYNLTIQLYI